jgi:hypothetical protein
MRSERGLLSWYCSKAYFERFSDHFNVVQTFCENLEDFIESGKRCFLSRGLSARLGRGMFCIQSYLVSLPQIPKDSPVEWVEDIIKYCLKENYSLLCTESAVKTLGDLAPF